MTAKLARGLPDLATTNVCKVNSNNRNHIERKQVNETAHHRALAEETSINFNKYVTKLIYWGFMERLLHISNMNHKHL